MKRTFVFLLAAGFLTLTACNDSAKVASASDNDSTGKMETTNQTKAQQNKQTVSSIIDAVNRQDVEVMFKNCSASYLDYGDGLSKPMTIDSVKSLFKEWFHAFPDFKADNVRYVAEGEWVVVWADWSATWKGDFMKKKANGKRFRFNDADFYRFDADGKLVEHRSIQPFSTIWTQIGLKM